MYHSASNLLGNIVAVGPVVLDPPGLVHGQDAVDDAQLVSLLLVEDLELGLAVGLDNVGSQAALGSNVVGLAVQDLAVLPLGAGRTDASNLSKGEVCGVDVEDTDLEKMSALYINHVVYNLPHPALIHSCKQQQQQWEAPC